VPGRGTSVKVYLPRMDQPAAVETECARRRAATGSETVLLVEDEDMVRRLVREALVRAGYKVMDTSDPVEARRLSESYRGMIHLLITDVVMPRVSGRELAEELRTQRGGMKVLYMSGYTDNAIVNTGILQKEVAFLQKPFTPAALTQKVREVLEGGGRTHHAGE
jgi:DNA-binding NtrC family response regulator